MSDLRNKIWFKIVIGVAASAIITLVMLLALSGVAALIGVGKTTVKIMNIVSIITSLIAGVVLVTLGKYFVMLFIENPTPEIFDYAQQVLNYSAI